MVDAMGIARLPDQQQSAIMNTKIPIGTHRSDRTERSATVKKQSGINGLLPARRAGPFHLFRLPLDLHCDVLKEGAVTFPQEKCFPMTGKRTKRT
jgi:hypothetical protein